MSNTATSSDDREALTALLDTWAAAIVANDAERMADFVTPDWTFVTDMGIYPGAQVLGSIASGDLTHDTMTFDVQQVRRLGDTVAVVTSRGANSGAFRGERFQVDEWTTDLFVWDRDGWRCVLTQLTPISATEA